METQKVNSEKFSLRLDERNSTQKSALLDSNENTYEWENW